MLQKLRSSHWYTIVFLFGCLAFAIALSAYVVTGSFMRMSGDDYCYGGEFRTLGFWGGQWHSYFSTLTYAGNRYSLTFFSAVAELFGPMANAVLPGLMVVLWLVGFFLALRSATRLTRWESLLAAEALIFFTLWEAPEITQVLYWRSGMLPYLAPMVVDTWLAASIMAQARRGRASWLGGVGCFFLAIVAGGFSETAAALQASLLGLACLAAWIGLSRQATWGRPALLAGAAALAGACVALAILLLCPTNLVRRGISAPLPELTSVVGMSLANAWSFVRFSIQGLILPVGINGLVFLLLGYQAKTGAQPVGFFRAFQRAVIAGTAIGLGVFVLVVSAVAPTAYVNSTYPEPRALFPSQYALVVGISGMGWVAGRFLATGFRPGKRLSVVLAWGALLVLVTCFVYPPYAGGKIVADLPRYRRWTTYWDARDQQIRAAQARGQQEIEVVQIDHIIPRVGELSPDPGFWYNNCAAQYYGLKAIRANQPGW